MAKMTIEEFGTVEKLKILKPVWVKGIAQKAGDIVELAGNDKVQLLGSKLAERVEKESKK